MDYTSNSYYITVFLLLMLTMYVSQTVIKIIFLKRNTLWF